MGTTGNIGQATYYHHKATTLMGQKCIPLTPNNYSVWYAYVTESNKELVKAIEELFAKQIKFTHKVNDNLYETYIALPKVSPLDDLSKQSVHEVLNKIIQELNGRDKSLNTFTNVLKIR